MGKVRYPLAEKFMTRDGTTGSNGSVSSVTGENEPDVYIQNGYVDKYNDKLYVMKRPGVGSVVVDFGVAGTPQGQFYFNGLFYAVYNDILYRSGGAENTGTDATAFTQSAIPIWSAREDFGAVVFQNKMWVIGGESTVQYADVSSTQDGVTWAVNAGAAPFGSRVGMGLVVFNNLMWAIGGQTVLTSTFNNDVWSTPDGETWTKVTSAAPWTPRAQMAVVAANGGIYVYGGQDNTPALKNDVWFSSDGATWVNSQAAAPWSARSNFGACSFNNRIWVIGGQQLAGVQANDVWSSLNGIDWVQTTAAAFAAGRSGMAVAVYNNKMWLLGGETAVATFDANVYSSTTGATWTLVTTTPGFSTRVFASALVFQTPVSVSQYRYPTIWVMGGIHAVGNYLQDAWYGNLNALLQNSYTLSPTSGGQNYQFATFVNGQYLLLKNQSDFWVLSSGTLIKITDPNYPPQTVPGIVILNQYAYVMTPDAVIRACALNDATLWPALQYVVASYEDDPGVRLSKYLNYIVAFGTYTTQFYYDNANPAPGISISAYINANIRVGCVDAATVQESNNTLIWIGQTSNRQWGVYMLDGMNPVKVSESWADKVINRFQNIFTTYTFITGSENHKFYVINFFNGPTIVYDIDYKQWYPWLYGAGTGTFPFVAAVTDFSNGGDFWFGSTNAASTAGKMYAASFFVYDDATVQFPLVVQTDKIDDDKMVLKFWGRLDFVADQVDANVTINTTDDDYRTYRTWGVVNLNGTRPTLNRGGASRRRAFQAVQIDSNRARWEAIELTVSEGES